MTPVDAAIVRRKLERITTSLEALRPLARLTLQEYRRRLVERSACERLLQVAIEAAIDINTYLIAELGGELPDDYHATFARVGDLGVLPPDLARDLAPSAGLRNRLVHDEYDALDDAKVHAALGTLLERYPRYVQAVEAYLVKHGV